MSIRVDNNWWQHIFDEIYLMTDARSVCNDNLTKKEVDFLETILECDRTGILLDMCGGHGRHSLELSRRGFKNVIVLDYSKYLLQLGRKRAKEESLNTIFIHGDARNAPMTGACIRSVIIMASSFGYFEQEEENRRILNEACRLLMPEGMILLDLPDRDYVLQNFKPFSSHSVNKEIKVTRARELDNDIIYTQERVLSIKKGCICERNYCTCIYSHEKISQLIDSAGFSCVAFIKDFMPRHSEGDFGYLTNRMIVTARK